jgi:hypothetical protein
VTLVVDKATPTLSWPSPVDITYGTALGGTQLDATASAVVNGSTVSVPGTFRYTLADGSTPALGAVLPVGQNQLLVSFTPSDTTDYFNAIGSTQLTVDQATLTATGVPAFAASLGTPFSGTVATFTNADPLGTAASYSAVIAWGDGSTSPAVITDEGDGLFAVSGSHTYLSAGTDAITVQINHNLGDTTSAAAHDTAAVSSDVVIAGAAGDTLEVMRTAGGGPGDVTYILNGGAPVSLHGVTSFTFVAGPGNATMIVDLANGGPIASGGAVSFSGGAGADTLDLQAAGLAVDVNSVGFNVGGQAVNFTGVAVTHIDDAGAVNTIAGPDTADRDAAFAGLTPQERFVQALYLDDLGRAGRRDELGYWVGVLGAPGGSAAVADGIMRSLEGRDHLVRSWYLAFLGRPAAGGEEVGWVNELLHGRPEEAVLGDILGGAEFLGRAQTLISSGSGDERFVRALYQVLLGRTPAGGEVAYWLDRLPQLGAAGVAQGFLRSAEYRTNLTESCYNVLLHRPSDAGRDYWVFSDLDGTSLRVGFEASAEFFAHG